MLVRRNYLHTLNKQNKKKMVVVECFVLIVIVTQGTDLKVGLWVILNLASTTIVLLKQEKGECLLKTFLKMLKCLFFSSMALNLVSIYF